MARYIINCVYIYVVCEEEIMDFDIYHLRISYFKLFLYFYDQN